MSLLSFKGGKKTKKSNEPHVKSTPDYDSGLVAMAHILATSFDGIDLVFIFYPDEKTFNGVIPHIEVSLD